jgi:putative flippase GtrA
MPPLTKRDLIIVAILGEIVGLFAYAISKRQGFTLPLMIFAVGVPIAATLALFLMYLLGKKVRPVFFQFGKFAAVGFSNTAIDWGILNLLLPPVAPGTGAYAIFKALSFGAATLNSFFWNRFWSFERKGTERIGREAVTFYVATAIGLGLNVAVATLVRGINPEVKVWYGIIAPAIGTVASMTWDFLAYRFFVFRPITH